MVGQRWPLPKQPFHIVLFLIPPHLLLIPAGRQIGFEGLQGGDLGQLGSQVVDITQQIVPMFGKGLLGLFLGSVIPHLILLFSVLDGDRPF